MDTAKHWANWPMKPANSGMATSPTSHRSDIRSYCTIGSLYPPSWLQAEVPQNVLSETGAMTGPPDLSKTTKALLTHWTIWLGPTAMFGSGGTPVTENPG